MKTNLQVKVSWGGSIWRSSVAMLSTIMQDQRQCVLGTMSERMGKWDYEREKRGHWIGVGGVGYVRKEGVRVWDCDPLLVNLPSFLVLSPRPTSHYFLLLFFPPFSNFQFSHFYKLCPLTFCFCKIRRIYLIYAYKNYPHLCKCSDIMGKDLLKGESEVHSHGFIIRIRDLY